jgi:hypothetical protein
MGAPQMPAKRLRSVPAFKANDVIPRDGAPDRNRRPRRLLHWGHATLESGEGSMHLDNQSCEFAGRKLVMPYIAPDDTGDVIGRDLRRRALFGHCGLLIVGLGCYRIGLDVSNHPRQIFLINQNFSDF